MPQVTISMPVWRTPPELLHRAIRAVQAQTFADWQLIVLGDGCTPAFPLDHELISDDRIKLAELDTNRGRYYCDAVAFAATDSRWFTIHDSDDMAEPRWLEYMVKLAEWSGADAVLAPQYVQRINAGAPILERVEPYRGWRRLHHHAHMAGLWSRKWLAEVGGPHPAFRVGFDTLLTSLPYIVGKLAVSREPLYNRIKRHGSLTTSSETGMRSEHRRIAREALERMWLEILRIREAMPEWPMPTIERVPHARHLIGQVLAAYPTPEAYAELQESVRRDAKRITDLIGDQA